MRARLVLVLFLALPVLHPFSAAGTWTASGPYWKAIRAVAVSPQDTNLLYAGAFGWGVFKSTDGGASWLSVKTGLLNTHVRSLVALSSAEVFCGTNDGVFRTTNGGGAWVSVWPTAFSVRGLAYDPGTGSLYAATFGSGLFKSTNHGASWTTLNVTDPVSAQTLSHQWDVAKFGTDSLYVGGSILDIASGGALFRSTDGGTTWIQVQRGIGIRSSVHAIAISPGNPGASLIIGTATKGVYKSTNGGTNWTEINGGGTANPLVDLKINTVGFSPGFRYAGTDSVGGFFSRSLGDTTQGWIAGTGLPGPSAVVNAMALAGSGGSTVYLGTEGQGVYRSITSGASWQSRNTGMLGTAARVVARNGNGDILLGTDFGDGIWRSTNLGSSWTKVESLATSNAITAIGITSAPSTVYAGAYGTGIYKSTDGGLIWHLTDTTVINHYVRAMSVHPTDPATCYAGTGNGVYKTTDGGTSWFADNGGVIPANTSIRSMALDPANPAVVYAGTDSSFLYKTTDGGASWTHATSANGFLPQDVFIRSITVRNSSILYVGSDSGRIYRSTNAGSSWTLLAALPIVHSVRSVLVHPNNPAICFAATFGDGVYVSADSGAHWAALNGGLADPEIYTLESDNATPLNLYAGSGSNGVFRMAYTFTNHPPVLAPIGGKSTLPGQLLAFPVSASDSDGTAPSLSASGLPAGASFVDSLNGHGRFAWTPSGAQTGAYIVTLRASDGISADSESVHITVLDSATSSIVALPVESGWEMVSEPVAPADSSMAAVFPTASSLAFSYEGSYTAHDTLRTGTGYWVKFPSSQTVELSGGTISRDTLDVRANWNMIGSISRPVTTAGQVQAIPPMTVTSNYFGYAGGYMLADTLQPGRAYWVKVDQAGKLVLASSAGQVPGAAFAPEGSGGNAPGERFSTLEVRDAAGHHAALYFSGSGEPEERYELPPPPPAGVFDLRFGSGRMLDSHPGEAQIVLSSAAYPVTVSWELRNGAGGAELGVDGAVRKLSGGATLTLERPAARIELRLDGRHAGGDEPRGYALARSYPNPFNPSTTITYAIPEAGFVTLSVYNLLGEEVAELVREAQGAGWHAAAWNAAGLPSGVYYYVLSVSGAGGGSLRYRATGNTTLLR